MVLGVQKCSLREHSSRRRPPSPDGEGLVRAHETAPPVTPPCNGDSMTLFGDFNGEDCLHDAGIRLMWVPGLSGDVLVLEDYDLVLADEELSRDEVERRTAATLREMQGG